MLGNRPAWIITPSPGSGRDGVGSRLLPSSALVAPPPPVKLIRSGSQKIFRASNPRLVCRRKGV